MIPKSTLSSSPLNFAKVHGSLRHMAMMLLSAVLLLWSFQGYTQVTSTTFNSPGLDSFAVPAGVTKVMARAIGAGGRGGTTSSGSNAGGGGGGGAYAHDSVAVVSGTKVAVYVGYGSSTDAPGDSSWFNTITTVLARGGETVVPIDETGGKNGGSAGNSIGSLRRPGGNGATGITTGGGGGSSASASGDGASGGIPSAYSGGVAPSGGGDGANGATLTGNGGNASAPGGGGGGSYGGGTGGTGGNGQVKVEYTCPTYIIDGITANDACKDKDTTRVTITSSYFPVGNYIIYYHLNSSPTPLTDTIEVTNENVASFLIAGLSSESAGTNSVTVDSVKSENCLTTLSSINDDFALFNNLSISVDLSTDTLCIGENKVLSVTLGASMSAVGYKWYSNNDSNYVTPTELATTATYSLTPSASGKNYYYVIIDGLCGSDTSAIVPIVVNDSTLITTEPVGDTLCVNAVTTLSVAANGANLVYDWYSNSVNAYLDPTPGSPDYTGASYLLPTQTADTTIYFYVIVTGDCGTDTSSIVTVRFADSTKITSEPVGDTLCLGESTSPLAVAASGVGLQYQWYSSTDSSYTVANRTELTGEISSTYAPDVSAVDTTWYYVIVTGACVADTSIPVAVRVNPVTLITDEPVGDTVCVNTTTTLTVDANGSNNTYEWYSNSVNAYLDPTPGSSEQTGTSYLLPTQTADTTIYYYVIVTGVCGKDTSDIVTVRFADSTKITSEPVGDTLCLGESTSPLAVTASGVGLQYQWYSSTDSSYTVANRTELSGEISSTYAPDVSAVDTTWYYVIVTGACVADTSVPVAIRVNPVTLITDEPVGDTVCVGNAPNSLSINAEGANLTYQWYSSTDESYNEATRDTLSGDGADTDTYSPPAQVVDTTLYYYVIVTGDCGTDTSAIVPVRTEICTGFTELTTTINSPHSGVYSDTVWVRARLVELVSGLPVQGDTVEFRIYNGSDPSIPSADVNIPPAITDANGFARSYITLTQDPDWSDTFDDRNGDTMHIRAYFAGDETYGSAERVENFNVRKEVAEFVSFDCSGSGCPEPLDAKKIKFNGKVGAGYIVTPQNTVDVTIQVRIQDQADGFPGDLTKARIRFELNPSGNTTPLVQYVVADGSGNATAIFNGLSTGTYGSNSFTVHVTVGDYYRGRLNSTLTVHKKGTAALFSGGGDILLSSSTGKYAGDPGTLSSFTLGSKFNKTASKVQGKASLIFTSKGRTYVVTGSGTPTVTFDSVGGVASYVSAASIADITFDSTGSGTLSTFASPSNLTLSYNMKDSAIDYVSVKVADGSTVWFTNQGSGGSTDRQVLIDGGMTITVAIPAPVGTSATRCGTGTLALGATPPSGATVDWYTDSTGGTLVQSGSTSYTTPVISTTTKYYAESRNTLTGARSATRTAITATVNAAPDAPVASDGSRCGTGSVPLSATAPANGSVAWYSATTGGSALSTSTTFNTPSISATTYYYVEAKLTATGCASPTRTKVTATVNAAPAAPTALASTAICGASGSTILSVSAAAGSSVEWYETSSSTVLLASGNTFTTPTLTASKTYYAMARNTTCASSRTAVTATVSALPAAPSSISGTLKVCPVNGTNYSFTAAKVTGAAGYAWTIPACASSNGSTTNSISVKFGTAGGNKDTLFVQTKNTAGCLSVKKSVAVTSLATCTSCYTGASANTQSRLSENEVYNPSAGLILKAFPNPNTGMFKLSVSGFGEGAALVRVMDLGGRLVYTTQPTLMRGTTWVPLNITQLPGGTYFVQVWQKDKMTAVKISKE